MPLVPGNVKSKVYIGVDPGQSGGLVAILPGKVVTTTMPATERDTWDWFAQYSPDWAPFSGRVIPCVGIIEKVHSFPGQGVASTFKFGMGYGFLRGCLIAAGIPFDEVTPRTWQKALSIPSRKKTESKIRFKNRLKAKAQQLFPNIRVTLAIADSLLIATYCKRKHVGLL